MEMSVLILDIVKFVVGFCFGVVPTVIALVRKCKKLKEAKTEAEKVAAVNDIVSKAKELVSAAEDAYSEVDGLLKKHIGSSAGIFKKESTLAKLQAYSYSKGYAFTDDELSDFIEAEVTFTNTVNTKK